MPSPLPIFQKRAVSQTKGQCNSSAQPKKASSKLTCAQRKAKCLYCSMGQGEILISSLNLQLYLSTFHFFFLTRRTVFPNYFPAVQKLCLYARHRIQMILAKTSAATEKYFKNFLKKKTPLHQAAIVLCELSKLLDKLRRSQDHKSLNSTAVRQDCWGYTSRRSWRWQPRAQLPLPSNRSHRLAPKGDTCG